MSSAARAIAEALNQGVDKNPEKNAIEAKDGHLLPTFNKRLYPEGLAWKAILGLIILALFMGL